MVLMKSNLNSKKHSLINTNTQQQRLSNIGNSANGGAVAVARTGDELYQ